jgi:hypothetical protein
MLFLILTSFNSSLFILYSLFYTLYSILFILNSSQAVEEALNHLFLSFLQKQESSIFEGIWTPAGVYPVLDTGQE